MQLEALCGNRAFFSKCNYKGNRGITWENSEELLRSAWICGSCGEPAATLWESLASRRLRMKSKENSRTCNVPASNFRLVSCCGRCCPMVSHWNQMASNRLTSGGDIKHTYPLHLTNLWPFKCHEKPCAANAKKWEVLSFVGQKFGL